ncbi:unnamed protein product [Periconia digitata]|uniref:FAD dependent oxidoreductase domain-containing protein n=1 Tax=Periconia digitata TaxID=1303443 RepID=A0A9W4U589_9PLEO|nr:unnamed protein product [Periconia digitata]
MGTILTTLFNALRAIRAALHLLSALSASFNEALKRSANSPGLPVKAPTKAYWQNNPPFPDLVNVSSHELPKTTDVAIIGSGIAGASIAWSWLHEKRRLCNNGAEEKVVVLEARELCSGATARNGGHIKVAAYEVFSRLCKAGMAKERAAALVRFQLRHVKSLIELCQTEGIDAAEAREVETVDVFADEEAFREAKRGVQDMKEWLGEVEVNVWEKDRAREIFGVNESIAGALSYQAGAIWAYRFTTSIWKNLLEQFPNTLSIETNTPVLSIAVSPAGDDRPKGFPYALQTPRGTIYAKHVVHATNAFASHLVPGLRSKIVGARAHMSAQSAGHEFTRCSTKGMRSWGVIYGDGFDYVTQRPAQQGDLMVGGGFRRSLNQGVDQVGVYDDSAALDALTMSHIAGVLPAIFSPNWGAGIALKQAWSGIIGLTGDFLPFVGPLDSTWTGRVVRHERADAKSSVRSTADSRRSGEWIAAGWAGEGMVWAWLCGVGLGIMIAGSEEDDSREDVPGLPGGRIDEWLPQEVLISKRRVQTADVSNLAS